VLGCSLARAHCLLRPANQAGEGGVGRRIEDTPMNTNKSNVTTYTTSDGRTWVEPIPEQVQRELAACAAIDILGARVQASGEATEAALRAVQAASAETPPKELIAAWAEHNAALIAVIADLTRAGTDTIDAVQRSLGLK